MTVSWLDCSDPDERVPVAALLVFIGLVGVLVGLFAIIRGRLGWARLRTRRQAALATAAAFLVMITGGLSSPTPTPAATAPPDAIDSTTSAANTAPPSTSTSATPAPPKPAGTTPTAVPRRAAVTPSHRRKSPTKNSTGSTSPKPSTRATAVPVRHPVLLHSRTGGVVLPNRHLTPGAVLSSVTRARVCVPGYSARVRHVTDTTRRAAFAAYRIPWSQHAGYEMDHLVPLELGGSNTTSNLWPEPQGAHDKGYPRKDLLENHLHALVCAGQVRLRAA